MADTDFPSPTAEGVIPTGPALVGLVNAAITDSLRLNEAPQVALPSLWRLAYHAVYDVSPLTIYRYVRTEGT